MNNSILRPYLVIPKLIEQPTWGGVYIIDLKDLGKHPFAGKVMIGQSYELFSGTKLYLGTSASDGSYTPELGYPDHSDTNTEYFPLKAGTDYITLSDVITEDPEGVLGNRVLAAYGIMPLLIKINHAKGNSFQLHIRPNQSSDRWKPKAESWYYLEDGLLTYGIRNGISLGDYKSCCKTIEQEMQHISREITGKKMSYDEANAAAKDFIRKQNPWQFVNTIEAKKFDLVDLSGGGLHHSWEEDDRKYPIGNVIYEVQQDVMDPVSTIRSFDQGKIKKDGTIRSIAIDDYFSYLDTDEQRNDIAYGRRQLQGTTALMTKHYAMDVISVGSQVTLPTDGSFVHLYVRDGKAEISAGNVTVTIPRGTSCFIPAGVPSYTIDAKSTDTVVLKTYVPDYHGKESL